MSPHIPESLRQARIAFLSMEIGLEAGMRCYSGGLGVLAGDFARAAADLGLPMVFVALLNHDGYVRQTIDADGRQRDAPDPWDPEQWCTRLPVTATIALAGRPVRIAAWLRELAGIDGAQVPVLLLDTDLAENDPADRRVTRRLYEGDAAFRLRQDAVLGLGGKAMLEALGARIGRYHLNEGHAALLPLALLHETGNREAVRSACVFTTHTPIAAGHERFAMAEVRRTLPSPLAALANRLFAGAQELDMTRLALELSGWANGVSQRHAEVSRRMFPDYRIHGVTNGIHLGYWVAEPIAALYDRAAPEWRRQPHLLTAFDGLSDADVWEAHGVAKAGLIDDIARRTGRRLDPDRPLIGYARRMTGYKRADLIFAHLLPLLKIAERHPFQLVFAGKAHPDDAPGKAIIARLHEVAHSLGDRLPLVFVPGYDMEVAAGLVSGCDVWLNTPEPPLEASGTSGMKAAANGVLNLSVLDGWWVEGCEHGRNGWGLSGETGSASRHAEQLLDCLEREVLATWYGDRRRWIRMMKHSVASLAPRFSAERALREYAAEAYGEAAALATVERPPARSGGSPAD